MSAHGVASGTIELDTVAPLPSVLLATPRRVLRMRSDAALVQRFRAGYEDAFSILYERHRAGVLAVCLGVLGSRHDAEDAAQDAFAALAIALRTNPPRELRAWLARVARNAAIDLIRRRRAVTSADEALEGQAFGHADVRVELESVFAGLRQLPESQRTALLMRELAGHSYLEIAELLELDESAVRGLIARARIGLRAHREATDMPCAAAREALATEPDGRRRDKTVRRHVRSCDSCKAYGRGLRRDAYSLRSIVPIPAGSFAGGGAIFGSLAAKTVLTGGALTQVTAACAVSACAVGGIALLYPHGPAHHHAHHAAAAPGARLGSAHRGTLGVSSPLTGRALDRAAADARTGNSQRSSSSTRLRGAPSTSPTAAGNRSKVVSSPTVAVHHRFQLPASGSPVTPAAAQPPAGTPATMATSSPTHPVFTFPARPGSTTGGSRSYPGSPGGLGSGHPGFGRGAGGTGAGSTSGTGSTTGTSGSTGTGTSGTSGTSGSGGTGGTPSGSSGSTGTTGYGRGAGGTAAVHGSPPAGAPGSPGASATAALAGELLGLW